MKATLTPYPAYKPTAIPWLQQVPEHWEVQSLGSLTTAIVGRNRTDLPLLSVVREKGVILRSSMSEDENHNRIPDDLSNYKHVRKGNLVINKMKAWQGSLGIAPVDGIVSPAYYVFDLHVAEPMYGHVLLRSKPYVGAFAAYSDGVRIGQWDLSIHGMRRIPVVLPPPAEQHLIVRYLHALDAKVKRYIRTKRTLIARLQEQKQAIIQRAVTRGLDPNVKLKPSGVEWLGEVPEHWEVKRGKAVFEVIDKRSKTGNEELLSVSAVNGVVFRSSSEVHMFMAASYVGHKLCWPEDLVINSLWAWAKGFGFSRHHGIVSTAYSVYRLRPQYKSLWEYLDVLLRSGAYDWDFTVRSRGVWKSRLQLTDSSFLDMRMILPSTKEADEIIEYVRTETKDLDEALTRVNKEIKVLQEYHVRLIADVVTGAVDVREAAGKLPEEDQMIGGSDDQMMKDEVLSLAAEGEAEYGNEEVES